MRRVAAALLVGAAAFCLYRATLLPGFDFGDTGSFQTSVASPLIRSRDAYPLYFAIGRIFLRVAPGGPAHALNLASAAQAALACGLLVLLAEELSGSLFAAIAAAVVFGGSYTFWSQAVIAEVYALHLVFVAATLLLLLRWQRQPSAARLSAFFAVYALGFGNHLSMVLLFPAYVVFLLSAAPRGWRSMFTPRIVGLAVLFACVGAAQYAWDFLAIWSAPQPPGSVTDAAARFWFDVTKTDWRDTMVLNVPVSMLPDRLRMYWFDLRQQFGPVLPAVAALGLAWLFRIDWRRGILLLLAYLGPALFAYGYNVGDTHVFYLPAHLCVALLLAVGVSALAGFICWCSAGLQSCFGERDQLSGVRRPEGLHYSYMGIALALAIGGYGLVRAHRDYPALDRSGDTRPAEVLTNLTAGLGDRHGLLLTDMHWQIENGRSYFGQEVRPGLEYARMPDVILHAPALIADNLAIEREVVATSRARQEIVAAYGPLVSAERDPRALAPALRDIVSGLSPGTRYVLCVLKPTREFSVETADVNDAIRILSGGAADGVPAGQYAVVAGLAGERPAVIDGSNDPFTRTLDLSGVPTQVRMESWLAFDTIRRMGFGHVVAARQHTLIVERGVSFVAFDGSGRPLRTGYEGNIFAAQPRYLITIARGMVDP